MSAASRLGAGLGRSLGRSVGLGRVLARDKADTLLLLAGALLVLAPHALHLPLWVSALCGATLLWRASITLRGARMPPGVLLLPVALASMGAVYLSFHTLLGRDAGVAMLVLLVAFKMLEMHARRDLVVVILLCLFLVLTNFFYSQSILTALMMVASVVVLLSAQLSFQFTGVVPPLRQRLLMGARIAAYGAPLALALFLLFPRFQGPLWGMPDDAHSARTGLSNTMEPGSMSSLADSNEPAFRVKFIDPAPAQSSLYWRGVVLGAFDGRVWSRVRRTGVQRRAKAVGVNVQTRGPALRHEVTLEPSGHRWLFALDLADALPRLEGDRSEESPELEMLSGAPLDQRVRYEVASHIDYRLEPDAELDERAMWLQLPDGANPRALGMGQALAELPEPAARVQRVLRMFHQEAYSYTLEPPLLGADGIDEFLFSTRAGFCEHFAGAFVFLMRAADVPARVVMGYQGGERNPVDGFLTVRQSDAHAWAEVWLAGQGWVRVDPTAAVAPERVKRGLGRAVAKRPPFGIEGLSGLMNFTADDNGWLAQLRFRASAMNNRWNQWVLNYTPARQKSVMESLRSALLSWSTLGALLAGALLVFGVRAWQQRRQGDPVDALYSLLCSQLARIGMARAIDEGPSAYAARLAGRDLAPAKKAAALRFLALYSAYKYGPPRPDPGLRTTLKRLLTESQ